MTPPKFGQNFQKFCGKNDPGMIQKTRICQSAKRRKIFGFFYGISEKMTPAEHLGAKRPENFGFWARSARKFWVFLPNL